MTSAVSKGVLGSLAVLLASLPAFAQDQNKGRALAEALCARCHMNEGQGDKESPMEVPGFRAIANRPHQSLEGIVRWLRSTPPMMPNHHLTQDEMYDLAGFILSLRKEGSGRGARQAGVTFPRTRPWGSNAPQQSTGPIGHLILRIEYPPPSR